MWEGALSLLEDSDRNVRDAAHQTLRELMKYDDVRESIPNSVCQRLAGVLNHSEWYIRRIALETLRAFLDHDNTRSLFTASRMWERVVEMLEDPDRDVGDGAQQTLTAFMKHGDFESPALPFLHSPCTRR
ncbi:hypothetical protein B0H19DRAFT_196306 [Mycena capillaripes]|nr:hypothetical protein B0H19DRAFT_196306 [Mycena capillaripes]